MTGLDPAQLKILSGAMDLRDSQSDPEDVIPGEHVTLPQPDQFPAEYWSECDAMQKQAVEVSGALYTSLCVKESGPAFAVTALVPGHNSYVQGPARDDRVEAWKAFIEQYAAS